MAIEGGISVTCFSFTVIYKALRLPVLAPFGSCNLHKVNAPFRRAGSAEVGKGRCRAGIMPRIFTWIKMLLLPITLNYSLCIRFPPVKWEY